MQWLTAWSNVSNGAANGRIKLPKLGCKRQAVEGALLYVSMTKEGSGKGAKWFASMQIQVR